MWNLFIILQRVHWLHLLNLVYLILGQQRLQSIYLVDQLHSLGRQFQIQLVHCGDSPLALIDLGAQTFNIVQRLGYFSVSGCDLLLNTFVYQISYYLKVIPEIAAFYCESCNL